MIDLSPQPQDKSSSTAELHPAPRHDSVAGQAPGKTGRWPFTHDEAEAGVQLLSRWAGPAILIATLGLMAWFAIG